MPGPLQKHFNANPAVNKAKGRHSAAPPPFGSAFQQGHGEGASAKVRELSPTHCDCFHGRKGTIPPVRRDCGSPRPSPAPSMYQSDRTLGRRHRSRGSGSRTRRCTTARGARASSGARPRRRCLQLPQPPWTTPTAAVSTVRASSGARPRRGFVSTGMERGCQQNDRPLANGQVNESESRNRQDQLQVAYTQWLTPAMPDNALWTTPPAAVG